MKIKVYEVLKTFEVTEKRSPWFGTHESGIIQIPADEFTPEKFAELTEGENPTLKLIEEKEGEDYSAPEAAAEGTETKMDADTGTVGAEVQGGEAAAQA